MGGDDRVLTGGQPALLREVLLAHGGPSVVTSSNRAPHLAVVALSTDARPDVVAQKLVSLGYGVTTASNDGLVRSLRLVVLVLRLRAFAALVIEPARHEQKHVVSALLRLARLLGVPSVVLVASNTTSDGGDGGQTDGWLVGLASRVIAVPGASEIAWVPTLEGVGARLSAPPRSGCAPLARADMERVCQVHRDAFPDAALTRLGDHVVRRYYRWQFVGPHPAPFALGVWRDGELVGFVFGGVRRVAVAGFARHSLMAIALGALRHPGAIRLLALPKLKPVLRAMARRGRPAPGTAPVQTVGTDALDTARSAGILALAVDPRHQGSGAASELLAASESAVRAAGMHRMHLTVGVANHRAIAFYEKHGWTRSPVGSDWAGLMVISLGEA